MLSGIISALLFGAWAGLAISVAIFVVRGILSFVNHVVSWFRREIYNDNQVGFIGQITNNLRSGNVKHVRNASIYKGVYDQYQDEITSLQVDDAEQMDRTTRSYVRGGNVVVFDR